MPPKQNNKGEPSRIHAAIYGDYKSPPRFLHNLSTNVAYDVTRIDALPIVRADNAASVLEGDER